MAQVDLHIVVHEVVSVYSPEEVGKWPDITGRKQPFSLQLTQQGETRETLCAVGQALLEGNGIDVFGSQPLRDVLNKHLVGMNCGHRSRVLAVRFLVEWRCL